MNSAPVLLDRLSGVGLLAWVGLLATLGLAWHECVLLANAALAACRIELWALRREAAVDLWRLGLRCLLAGSIGLLAVATLGVLCLFAAIAAWCRATEPSTLVLVALSGALLCGLQSSARRVLLEGAPWLLLLVGAAIVATRVAGSELPWTCLVAESTMVYVGSVCWSLARDGTAMLAGAAGR